MGILYTMYKRDISKGLVKDICKKSIYTTQGISKDYIGLKSKVYSSILGSLYSKVENLNSNFNGILPIDKQTNKETKLDVKIIFIALC